MSAVYAVAWLLAIWTVVVACLYAPRYLRRRRARRALPVMPPAPLSLFDQLRMTEGLAELHAAINQQRTEEARHAR